MLWNDSKRSLHGFVKMFSNSERQLTSWAKLKIPLLDEFKTATNTAQLNKLISESKIKKGKSLQEYFLHILYTQVAYIGNLWKQEQG